jgi:hypothetical protein
MLDTSRTWRGRVRVGYHGGIESSDLPAPSNTVRSSTGRKRRQSVVDEEELVALVSQPHRTGAWNWKPGQTPQRPLELAFPAVPPPNEYICWRGDGHRQGNVCSRPAAPMKPSSASLALRPAGGQDHRGAADVPGNNPIRREKTVRSAAEATLLNIKQSTASRFLLDEEEIHATAPGHTRAHATKDTKTKD